MATKKVAKVVEVAQVVAPVEVLEQVSTNVSMVDAAGNELTGIHLIRARAAAARAARDVKPELAEELISGLLDSMNVPEDEIENPFPVAASTQVELKNVVDELEPADEVEDEDTDKDSEMNTESDTAVAEVATSTLDPELVEATVAESMEELEALVQEFHAAQKTVNDLREKLGDIAKECKNEMRELNSQKLAVFTPFDRNQIYKAIFDVLEDEELSEMYVGFLKLDEYGADDGSIPTPYPESFNAWCKMYGYSTNPDPSAEDIKLRKLQKVEYLNRMCQAKKALKTVQPQILKLFEDPKSSAKVASPASSGIRTMSPFVWQGTIKLPDHDEIVSNLAPDVRANAKSCCRVTLASWDKGTYVSAKGPVVPQYLKSLGIDSDHDEYGTRLAQMQALAKAMTDEARKFQPAE